MYTKKCSKKTLAKYGKKCSQCWANSSIYDVHPCYTSKDLVEVVRCKDCKYYHLEHLQCVYPHHNGVINYDGYCSYGERKQFLKLKELTK